MFHTYFIAELSANHGNDIQRAKETIKVAKECGADAIKIQTYTADTLTIDCKSDLFKISGGTLWDDKYLYDLYQEAYTPWEWQAELKQYADTLGIDFFSTPFDKTAVDFLEDIGVKKYKIASFEAVDIPLIEYTASKGKPMIISTGICNETEIQEAINACYRVGNTDITILKCTSSYPAKAEDMNLMTIPDMKKFGVKIGLSDHSMDIEASMIAVALGATVIEKHVTLDRALGGVDSAFSLNVEELKQTIDAIRKTERLLGNVDYSINEKNRRFARSLFICEDIKKGDIFTEKNLRSIRPSNGCPTKLLQELLGKKAIADYKKGTPMKPEYVEKNKD